MKKVKRRFVKGLGGNVHEVRLEFDGRRDEPKSSRMKWKRERMDGGEEEKKTGGEKEKIVRGKLIYLGR